MLRSAARSIWRSLLVTPCRIFRVSSKRGVSMLGDLDVAHPYVSPLNGDFRGLAPRDLLYPDSIELAAKARAAGVPIELHLRQGQPHNYAGMPTPEGRQARAIILRVVAGA